MNHTVLKIFTKIQGVDMLCHLTAREHLDRLWSDFVL